MGRLANLLLSVVLFVVLPAESFGPVLPTAFNTAANSSYSPVPFRAALVTGSVHKPQVDSLIGTALCALNNVIDVFLPRQDFNAANGAQLAIALAKQRNYHTSVVTGGNSALGVIRITPYFVSSQNFLPVLAVVLAKISGFHVANPVGKG